MWKSTSSIINQYLILEILYHDTLHGFWMRRGMGTANFKSELLQQITAIREAVLHNISLDPHKSHNSLDQDRCLEILYGYGMGTKMLRLLHT